MNMAVGAAGNPYCVLDCATVANSHMVGVTEGNIMAVIITAQSATKPGILLGIANIARKLTSQAMMDAISRPPPSRYFTDLDNCGVLDIRYSAHDLMKPPLVTRRANGLRSPPLIWSLSSYLQGLSSAETDTLCSVIQRVRRIGYIYVVVVLMDNFCIFKTSRAHGAE